VISCAIMRFRCLLCFVAILVVAGSVACAERMDGTKWKVKVTPDKESADKGAKEFDDEFIFADGQFTSTALQVQGFKSGPYRFETEGDDVEWSADKENSAEDMAGWGGRVNRKTTSGNFHSQTKSGISLFYKFLATKE
jgi:hypothetical protein